MRQGKPGGNAAIWKNILDPETIILGGALPDTLIDRMIARIALGTSVANRRDRTVPRVIRGRTGQMTAALGAAALPFSNAITPRLDTHRPLREPNAPADKEASP